MVYNTTNITAARNIFQYYQAINQLSNTYLTALLMLVIFLIVMVMYANYDKKVVFMANSFFLTIIGVLFLILGLINWTVLIFPILLLFGSILVNTFIR